MCWNLGCVVVFICGVLPFTFVLVVVVIMCQCEVILVNNCVKNTSLDDDYIR